VRRGADAVRYGLQGLIIIMLQQLTKLQHLTLGWDWITTYFEGDTVPLQEYTPNELQSAAVRVHAVMHGIAERLPQLQQLRWLCDIAN
jgi:hypothetical protein